MFLYFSSRADLVCTLARTVTRVCAGQSGLVRRPSDTNGITHRRPIVPRMELMRGLCVVVLFLVLHLGPGSAESASVHLDSAHASASDSAVCGRADSSPCATLAGALLSAAQALKNISMVANAGGPVQVTVLVAAGTQNVTSRTSPAQPCVAPTITFPVVIRGGGRDVSRLQQPCGCTYGTDRGVGGILTTAQGANVTVSDVTLTACRVEATAPPLVVATNQSRLQFQRCSLMNGRTTAPGGAIVGSNGAAVVLEDCTVQFNTAPQVCSVATSGCCWFLS